MNKKDLSDREISAKFINPAIEKAVSKMRILV